MNHMWDLHHLKAFSSAIPLPLDFKPDFLLQTTYCITGLLKDAIKTNLFLFIHCANI